VRWHSASFDASAHDDQTAMLMALRDDLAQVGMAAEGRPVALRLTLQGATPLHAHLTLNREALREDIETLLATLSGDHWLERLIVATTPPPSAGTVDPSVAGRLTAEIDRLAGEPTEATLEARLAEIRAKLPAGAHADAFIDQMRADIPARAAALARSLVSEVGHAAD
jgi:exonuclease SbcD